MSNPEKNADLLPDFKSLWDFQNPASTEEKFLSLLPRAQESGDLSYLLELKTQIARTQSLRRQFDKAHYWLDQVEPLINDNVPRAKLRYLLERGRTLNSAGKAREAKPLFVQAYEFGSAKKEDDLALDAAHMVAIAASPQESLEWADKSIAIAKESQKPAARNWLGPLYHNAGMTCIDIKDYPRAMDYFENALTFRWEQGQPEPILIARWMIAHTKRLVGNIEEAHALQISLLEDRKKDGSDNTGFVHEELGECLLLMNRGEEAKKHFREAWPKLKDLDWIQQEQPERLERLKKLAGEA